MGSPSSSSPLATSVLLPVATGTENPPNAPADVLEVAVARLLPPPKVNAGKDADVDAIVDDFDSALSPGTFQLKAATPLDAVAVDGSCPSLEAMVVEKPVNEFVDNAEALAAFTPDALLEEKPLDAFVSPTTGSIK